ncbi:MAG: type IV pilus twitching motility protein PilT [Candidatus Desantisbacteria bacterium]
MTAYNEDYSFGSLLQELIKADGSDLHIRAGEPPFFRINGKLKRADMFPPLTQGKAKSLLYSIMSEERQQRFEEHLELDMSYTMPGIARFRVNVFQQQSCIGAAIRMIPFKIQTIDELKLPGVLKQLSLIPRGLILVTGPTGSGKSTTLAAMIDHINSNRKANIVSIEDPIEFVHIDRLSVINQREVGVDAPSFAEALKHVMRQNPDVILVGEMRDLETMASAITAAETGVIVFATLHTNNAVQTIDRIIDVFPIEQQQQVRLQLAVTLQAIVSQTIVPKINGEGRAVAFEIMIALPAIKALVREGKAHQMYSIIQASGGYGMRTLDQDLVELVKDDIVSYEEALARSPNPKEFEQRVLRVKPNVKIGG